ncbi:MAG: sigma-54-dependent Fis family transcriptional regulator, partial [Chloroflexi bacterium]|nr:sigma-54-dependent Fis family transcriptional regulator [Chloroflexota bacterium]
MNSRTPANILLVSEDEDIHRLVKMILSRDRNDSVKTAANLDELAASIEQQIPELVILEFT